MKKNYLLLFLLAGCFQTYANFTLEGPALVCPNTEANYNIKYACAACTGKDWTLKVEGGVFVKTRHGTPDPCGAAAPFDNWQMLAANTTTVTYNRTSINAELNIRWGSNIGLGKITISGSASLSCCLAYGNGTTCPTQDLVYPVVIGIESPKVVNRAGSFCINRANSLDTPLASGATKYEWATDNGTIQATNALGTQVSLIAARPGIATVSVVAINANCGVRSAPYITTINQIYASPPPTPGPILDYGDLCLGDIGYYSLQPVATAVNYKWTCAGAKIIGSGLSATVEPARAGRFTVSVEASNVCGTSTSTSLTVTVRRCAARTSVEGENQLAVLSPNPAVDAVSLALPASYQGQAYTVYLLDIFGRTVQELSGSPQYISLKEVGTGVYTVRIVSKEATVVERLVVNKQ